MKKLATTISLALLAALVIAGAATAALHLEGQSGVFLNALAYPVAASKVEVSSHTVDLDDLGSITTYNFATGLKGGVELGYTGIASSVTGVKDQSLFLGKWQFAKEAKKSPAVALWAIHRSLTDGPSSNDYGLSATKVVQLANRPLVLDAGVRSTRALGLGLFGFQKDRETRFEGSAALFVTPKLAVGTEFKQQPGVRAWHDIALRWVPSKNFNLDFGIANLNSALDNQVALAATWTN